MLHQQVQIAFIEQFIQNHPSPWILSGILQNPAINFKVARYLIDKYGRNSNMKDISYKILSRNSSITLENILENIDQDWDWKELSYHSAIPCYRKSIFTLHEILRNKHLPWVWCSISRHPQLTLKHIIDNPDIPWCFDNASFVIPINDILSNTQYPWNWNSVSFNHHLTFQDYLSNPDKPWVFDAICRYVATIHDVLRNPEIQWNYSFLSASSRITIQDMLKHRELPWDWKHASTKITDFNDVICNPDITWDFKYMSYAPCITLDVIKMNIDKAWEWCIVCIKIKITFDDLSYLKTIIESDNKDWIHASLATNKHLFDRLPESEYILLAQRILAASKIKRAFKYAISNPYKMLCQRRLHQEFIALHSFS
ncbi:MAG: hypothetical protein ACK5XN_32230 [Bacteroidota bacterium]